MRRLVWLEQSKRGEEREDVGAGKGQGQVHPEDKGKGHLSAVITEIVILLPDPFGGRSCGLAPHIHSLLSPLEIGPAQLKTTFPSLPYSSE